MKTIISLVLFSSLSVIDFTPTPDAIIGTWLTHKKDSHVRIYKKDNKYYGRIEWLKTTDESAIKDIHNKNAALRNRSLNKLIVLSDFEYNNKKWTGGQLYNPRDGGTYDAKIALNSNKELVLTAYWTVFSQTVQ